MKYVCKVCGFVYDERQGLPGAGTPPGTTWDSLPEDWVCPLCGASKSEFAPEEPPAADAAPRRAPVRAADEAPRTLTEAEISALCSNLAKGCEKQALAEEAAAFTRLAEWFRARRPEPPEPSFSGLLARVNEDLSVGYPAANEVAAAAQDRGALRALVWSEKVTRILRSLIERYEREGDRMTENTGVWVCPVCGFVYVGDAPPELCPVCKVAQRRLERIA